jgi:protein involved in polysaccharide export with SLBB domain
VVGGVTTDGTLRRIRVVRAGQDVAALDAYDYLIDGRTPSPVRLQQGDRLFVPPRGKTVAIRGAVRREARYELLPGEGLAELIAFASGLEAEAYAERFQVERIVPFVERRDPSVARQVLDLPLVPVLRGEGDLALEDGDRVRILSILEEGTPGVEQALAVAEIEGAVYQPGRFEIGAGVQTLRDLIDAADGLLPGAYGGRAALTRLQPDGTRLFLPVALPDVLADAPQANVVLRPGDRLEVFATRDLEGAYTYEVAGQVLRPGERPFLDGISLYDALFEAGGLQDPEFLRTVLRERADLFRLTPDGEQRQIIRFDLGRVLAGDGLATTPLRPGDVVRVYPRRVEELVEEEVVTVSGAVKEPGTYALQSNTTVEDLILQADGFAEGAFVQAVEVTRMADATGGERAVTINVPVQPGLSVEQVGLGEGDAGFRLSHGDRVFVRYDPAYQPQETVLVVGEVVFPGEYTLLQDNETLASLVQRAGGLSERAYAGGGRLLRGGRRLVVDMGDAVRGRRGASVVLQAGDQVVIPSQPNTVAIEGGVANPGLIKFVPRKRVSYYLDRAGGVADDMEAVLITQASGATFKLREGLFPEDPVVEDGAIIRVLTEEEDPNDEGVDAAEIVRDSLSILTGAATVLVTLIVALTR